MKHALALLLVASATALAQRVEDGIITYPDGFTMEVGVPGELPPQAVGGEPLFVHDDTTGGANQDLLALTAGAGGFSAAWVDLRDGNLGLFVGHLSADGSEVVDGAPVHLPRSSRQAAPRLALAAGSPDGARRGAVAWLAAELNGDFVMLRGIGPEGEPEDERGGAAALLDLPKPLTKLERASAPRLVIGPDGVGLAAWLDGDRLVGRVLLPDPTTGLLGAGPRVELARAFAPLADQYELALGPAGHAMLVWAEQAPPTPEAEGPTPIVSRAVPLTLKDPVELVLQPLGQEPPADLPADGSVAVPEVVELGPGRPLELAGGPKGFWLALGTPVGVGLSMLSPAGEPVGAPVGVAGGAITKVDLTTWSDGRATALLVETKLERDGPGPYASAVGRLALHVFDTELARMTPQHGLEVLDPDAVEARSARLAALGSSFLVAWTDERSGDRDVWFRLLDLASLDAPARRWNRDEASSNQAHVAVASDGDQRAAVAWEDEREGTPRIWSRGLYLGQDGALAPGPERPVDPGGAERCAFPAVAVAPTGDRLVIWKEQLGSAWILRGRALAGDGTPHGPARDLDPGHTAAHAWPAALEPLPGSAGYVAAWIRPDEGPMLQRLSADGRPLGKALRLVPSALGAAASLRNIDLERLDDGRLVVAWDQLAPRWGPAAKQPPKAAGPAVATPPPMTRQVLARLLDPRDMRAGKPVTLGRSPMGGDHDPALAATPGGGFLVAWTGNDGPVRDVFAQAFDKLGRPADPLLAISVKANEQDFADAVRLEDGRVLVAWEDDISGRDHCFARALDTRKPSARRYPNNQRPPRGELFERRLINDLDTVYVEDRHAPRVAPMAGGYLVAYDDLARGRGHDIVARWYPLP